MVLIDRPLNEAEKNEISVRNKVDITAVESNGNRIKKDILAWIDTAEVQSVNGQSPTHFFSVDGESYWLQIRARFFYELYNDAQILDRIPNLEVLSEAEIVYCEPAQVGFWKRWTPNAELKISSGAAKSKTKTETPFNRLKYAFRNQTKIKHLLTPSFDGMVFSGMMSTVLRDGFLVDKKLETFYEVCPSSVVRLEYQTVPKYNPKTVHTTLFDNPRRTPTLPSDVLLFLFAKTHPIKCITAFTKAFSRIRKQETLQFEYTFDFKNEVWQSYLTELWGQYRFSFVHFHVFRAMFKWVLTKINPAFVLATAESNSIGRTFIEEAKKLGVLTFGIQHGDISPHNIDYRYSKELTKNAFPDYFFSWGTQSKTYLNTQSHIEFERMYAVGQIEYDEVFKELAPEKEIEAFRQERNKPVLFFGSQQQQNQKSRVETARLLAEFCSKNDWCCSVKLHPREDRDGLHRAMFKEIGKEEDILMVDCNVYSAIQASDYSATCYSTIAWEVMGMKKPLIIIDPLQLNLLKLRDLESVLYVTGTEHDFEEWNKNMEKHIEANYKISTEKLGPRDGATSKRVASVINELVYRR